VTPSDEARFIQLWQQDLDTREIGRQLGIPRGTVGSRAKRLVDQGKIQPRPRGGSYPKQRALARQDGAPPPADHPRPPRDPPTITMVAVPELRELINCFSMLEARVAALEDGTRTPPAPVIDAGGPRALVSIYALQDPETQEVRYIGQTVSPDLRFRVHMRGRGESTAKTAWVRSLLQRDKEPELVILEGGVPADAGATREAYWLDHYRNLGADLLNFNVAQPHPQAPPTPTRTPGTIKQWTVRLSQTLIDAVKAQAAAEGKEPSHLVEEVLWHALSDRRSST
jgi:hypothetical protein